MWGLNHLHVTDTLIVCYLILVNKCEMNEEIGSLYLVPVVLLVPVFQQIKSTFPIKPPASCGEEDVDSSVKGFLFKGLNMLEMILPSAFDNCCCLRILY